MWKHYINISALIWVGLSDATAQGGTIPMQANQSPSHGAAASISGPTSGVLESNTFLEMSNRVFNPDSDSMDFENGSFEWKGRSFNLTNQRAFRARFERFLLASPAEEEARYAALMDQIVQRLSVANDNSDDTIIETWSMLFRASDYAADGGNSTIIANQVFNAWRVRKESRGSTLSQRELEDLRKYQQDVVANRDRMLRQLKERRQRESAQSNGQQGQDASTDSVGNLTSEAAFRALDLVETEAKIVALEAQAALTGVQAKIQFQSQIVNFMMQRRFQHALILSGFYQLLFKGSQQQLEVGKGQLMEFFPNSDLSFTVDTLGFVAREAMNDIEKGVVAVNSAYAEKRQMIALERLQETFFLGEYATELNLIPTEQRRSMLDLYRALIEAGELAESRDYIGVEDLAGRIALMAKDFPLSRVKSSVESAKSMSNMAVFAAAQYRNLGDIDKAREELERAVKIWPSNPAINEFQIETTKLATAGSKGVQVFDDLYKRKDYRGIYERRMDLGFALADDEVRRPLLMEVVGQVSGIEVLVAQSAEMLKQGDAYQAWEFLAKAAKISADDPALNKARAELAPRVAQYVMQLDRAQRRSDAGQPAAALAAYLAAQDIYAASSICHEGIEREATRMMEMLQAEAAGQEPAVQSQSTAQ